MARCTCENWTLEDLAMALQDMHKDNKVISVPMFQRGKRWTKEQQQTFIDSLLKGYPVGTMLFYETFEGGKQTYILVDGLQRGNSIKKYMNDPTEFFYDSSISDEFCESILQIVDAPAPENYPAVRVILKSFITTQKTFKSLQYFAPAKALAEKFHAGFETIESLIDAIAHFFDERQSLYDQIASTVIPVIVYHGDESNLPEIFDRINSKGTALDQYEVYAAAWPVNRRFSVKNEDIVNAVTRKYDAFIADGYTVHNYDRGKMHTSKMLTAFEYLFGLSKVLVNKYDILRFNAGIADDAINSFGFELVNACFNNADKIGTLYEHIYAIPDINTFETALYKAVDFVAESIAVITRFKGNMRTGTKIFHSKYQIMSMIATAFREMYEVGKYNHFSKAWNEQKDRLSENFRLYYVYDILTDEWSSGGTKKIFSAGKRYMSDIPPRAWRTALDGFFDKSMARTESKSIVNPKSEEYVILNCIYLSTFTAMDQLSIDRFDVEHIAPKEQMKKLIATCKGQGLPISCIANLCYLPEYANRSKRDKNFYQDTAYLQKVNIDEIERKYSFTTSDDLEWMDMPYEGADDYKVLRQFYTDFCVARFAVMKKLFCDSMGIDYEAMNAVSDDEQMVLSYENTDVANVSDFYGSCAKRIESSIGKKLLKVKRTVYKSEDGRKGYVLCLSKSYEQGNRKKYWFGYRRKPLANIQDCAEQYIVYGCKDASEIICMPVGIIEERLPKMNYSAEDGEITHWHIVLMRDSDGNMTQLLSKPDIEEVDVNQYKI